MVEVSEVLEVDGVLVDAMARLLPQLSVSAASPTAEHLRAIVGSPATTLLVARDDGAIVGTLTLAVFTIPSGVRAWIEDVITDGSARGRGVGRALTAAAVEAAGRAGARTVELTSRPSREAANRLYRRVGFEPRETNVYRLSIPSTA